MSLKKYSSFYYNIRCYYYIFFPREPRRHTYKNYFKNVNRKCQLLIDFKTDLTQKFVSINENIDQQQDSRYIIND